MREKVAVFLEVTTSAIAHNFYRHIEIVSANIAKNINGGSMKKLLIGLLALGNISTYAIEKQIYDCQYRTEVTQHGYSPYSYTGSFQLTTLEDGVLLTNDSNHPDLTIFYYNRFGITVDGRTVLRTRRGMGGSLFFSEGSLEKTTFSAYAEDISGDDSPNFKTRMKCKRSS